MREGKNVETQGRRRDKARPKVRPQADAHVLLKQPHRFKKDICTVCYLPRYLANPFRCAGPQLPGV